MRRHLFTCMGLSLVLAAVAIGGCGGGAEDDSERRQLTGDEASELLVDRNWLDRWPRSKDERLHVYRFTPEMGGGVYQDRTIFRGTFELFQFEAGDDTVTFYLPDEGARTKTGYRIERVDGPAPFDLRLTFDESPRGPRVYYGMSAESATGPLIPLTLQQ